jgi:hypothetical protein
VGELLPRFRRMLTEAGRDQRSVPVTRSGRLRMLTGSRFRDLGIARVVGMLPSAKSDQLLPTLDRADSSYTMIALDKNERESNDEAAALWVLRSLASRPGDLLSIIARLE